AANFGCAVAVVNPPPASTRLAGSHRRHGPYLGAGVWLKSRSSVTQTKLDAELVLPAPLYFATLGKTQSGRVIWTVGGVSSTNLVATIVSGATPASTQVTSGVSASNTLGPGPPAQWNMPGTMNRRA